MADGSILVDGTSCNCTFASVCSACRYTSRKILQSSAARLAGFGLNDKKAAWHRGVYGGLPAGRNNTRCGSHRSAGRNCCHDDRAYALQMEHGSCHPLRMPPRMTRGPHTQDGARPNPGQGFGSTMDLCVGAYERGSSQRKEFGSEGSVSLHSKPDAWIGVERRL